MLGKVFLLLILTVFMAFCVILIHYQPPAMNSPPVTSIDLPGQVQSQEKCTNHQANYLVWVKEVKFTGFIIPIDFSNTLMLKAVLML